MCMYIKCAISMIIIIYLPSNCSYNDFGYFNLHMFPITFI